MATVEQVHLEITNLANRVDWPPLPKVESNQSGLFQFFYLWFGNWQPGKLGKGNIWPSTFGVPFIEYDP